MALAAQRLELALVIQLATIDDAYRMVSVGRWPDASMARLADWILPQVVLAKLLPAMIVSARC